MTETDAIHIHSLRARNGAPAKCSVTWDGLDRFPSVEDVRQTAEDLFTCAAYADLIGKLLRMKLDGTVVTDLIQSMFLNRQPRYFGAPSTLFILPGGSSSRGCGVVLLAKLDQFHKGEADTSLSPDEARAMGREWLTAAEASEADTLFSTVIKRSWHTPAGDVDALFDLIAEIRSGRADLPPEQPPHMPLPRL